MNFQKNMVVINAGTDRGQNSQMCVHSQASTYIELCFEQKCMKLRQGANILNEWRVRKESYCSFTNTTIYDFQHYSRHDASHSINILNYIEMVLGRERVEMLSVVDLWALLECAYFHDIGMAITYDQLVELWGSNSEFQDFLCEIAVCEDFDMKKAYESYKEIDDLLKKLPRESAENEFQGESIDSWPAHLQRYLRLLTTEYIRRHHSARSKAKMSEMNEKLGASALISFIPERLYYIVAEASYLHNENFEDIFSHLSHSEIGFDTERLHPQFIAAMLRLGDLLDMDNNRFDERAIEHFGALPYSSGLHYKKHKSLAHFDITNRIIEAKAVSDDKEVCALISGWFKMLDREVENLICEWNKLVPSALNGCLLQKCHLEIYYGDMPYQTELAQNYEIEKERLLRLTSGYNLYRSSLDCLREYIQNALDASKMEIWLKLKKGLIDCPITVEECKEVCPYDLEKRVFEDHSLEIGEWVDMENQKVFIRITDHGIGMESECVKGLSVVGRSWKQRAVYQKQIPSMPDWLRPTGGFGVGLQSAFMLTDEVVIYTKSEKEPDGYEIHLFSPQKKGSVTKQKQKHILNGTSIVFGIKLEDMYAHIGEAQMLDIRDKVKQDDTRMEASVLHENLSLWFSKDSSKDRFTEAAIKELIGKFLEYYIRKNVPNTLVPIHICEDKRNGEWQSKKRTLFTYQSPFASQEGGFGYSEEKKNDEKLKWKQEVKDGITYRYEIADDLTFRIWDQKESCSICIMSWPALLRNMKKWERELLNPMCYRNVRIQNGIVPEMEWFLQDFLSICIDIMGKTTEQVLDVQRSNFTQAFHMEQLMDRYLTFYVKHMVEYVKSSTSRSKIKSSLPMLEFSLMAIQLLNAEEADEICKIWKSKEYTPQDINMKKVNGKNGGTEVAKETQEEQESAENDEVESVTIAGKTIKNEFVEIQQVLKDLSELLHSESTQKEYTFFAIPLAAADETDVFSLWWNDMPEKESQTEQLQSIQESLRKDGTRLYVHPSICRMLQKLSNVSDSHVIRINEDPEKRVYRAVTKIRKRMGEQTQRAMSQKEFFDQVFCSVQTERYIGKNISCPPYDALKVKCIPGEESRIDFHNEYLIAPISNVLFRKVLEAAEADPDERKEGQEADKAETKKYIVSSEFTKKAFLDIIHQSSEFKFLISWVYENQCAKNVERLSKDDIKGLYTKMLEEMYQEKFFRKKE